MTTAQLHLATTDTGNALLADDPLALLIGMLLDQQIPMEKAFTSPSVLRERIGHDLDATEIANYDPAAFEELFRTPPALHRFPAAFAKRVQALAADARRAVRRPRRERLDGRGRRPGPGQADRPAARVRRAEGEDLRGAARQAVRGAPVRLAGGEPAPTASRARSGRWPTSSTTRRCRRCARSRRSRRPRQRPLPRPEPTPSQASGGGEGAGAHRVDLGGQPVDQLVGHVAPQRISQFATIRWPPWVSTDSGWNCTPSIGNDSCRSPITTPDSVRAVTTISGGNASCSIASEW